MRVLRKENMSILTKEMGGYVYHYTSHAQRKLYLGVEIEMDSNAPRVDGTTLANHLQRVLRDGGLTTSVEYDGSLLNGKELITHPATLDVYKKLTPYFLKAFRMMTDANYTDSNKKAGGHIHVSRRVFGKDNATREHNIDRLIAWVYVNRDSFKKFAMRDSQWAEYTSSRRDEKYVAINTRHEKTIEFRMFDGYKMFNNLIANLELVELLTMTITKGSVRVLENFTFDALIESYKRSHPNAYNQWLSVK
jgi:hypothetical protein